MKKILSLSIILLFLLTFIMTTISSATDNLPEDTSNNISFSWDLELRSYPRISVNNINYDEDTEYFTYISNSNSAPSIDTLAQYSTWLDAGWQNIRSDYSKIVDTNEYYERNEPIYIWVASSDYNEETQEYENTMLINGFEMERPEQLPLGSRLNAYFFSDYTSTFCYEPYSDDRNMIINYKIGEVTDTSLLRAIQNSESDALERLMEYSQSDTNGTTGSVSLGEDDSITSSLNLDDSSYYYVYLEVDDEDGTYIPIEDVSLYQPLITEDIGVNLVNYLDSNFTWNLPNENVNNDDNDDNSDSPIFNDDEDKTVAPGVIPQTGVSIAVGICIIITLGVTIYLSRKNRQYKGIK